MLSPSALRSDLYRILDRVLETGEPVQIKRKGRVLRIVLDGAPSRLDGLPARPDFIVGDPDELVEFSPAEPFTHDDLA